MLVATARFAPRGTRVFRRSITTLPNNPHIVSPESTRKRRTMANSCPESLRQPFLSGVLHPHLPRYETAVAGACDRDDDDSSPNPSVLSREPPLPRHPQRGRHRARPQRRRRHQPGKGPCQPRRIQPGLWRVLVPTTAFRQRSVSQTRRRRRSQRAGWCGRRR